MKTQTILLITEDYMRWRALLEGRIYHRTQRREYDRPGGKEKRAADLAAIKRVDDVLAELRITLGPADGQHRMF